MTHMPHPVLFCSKIIVTTLVTIHYCTFTVYTIALMPYVVCHAFLPLLFCHNYISHCYMCNECVAIIIVIISSSVVLFEFRLFSHWLAAFVLTHMMH